MVRMNDFDTIWLYSKYYANIVASAKRLNEIGENYAALVILLNVFELVAKSVRETDKKNLIDDIQWLAQNGFINKQDENFLNDEQIGVRKIRNLMMHRDVYQYCIEIDNVAYPFADDATWEIMYNLLAERLIHIMAIIVSKKQFC